MKLKASIATPALLLTCLCALAVSSVTSAQVNPPPPPPPLARCTATEDPVYKNWYCDHGSCNSNNSVECKTTGSGRSIICECKPRAIGDPDPETTEPGNP